MERSTLVACLVKAGFVILATRGIEGRGNRENQLNGVIVGAQRARRKINGIKDSKPSGAGFGEECFSDFRALGGSFVEDGNMAPEDDKNWCKPRRLVEMLFVMICTYSNTVFHVKLTTMVTYIMSTDSDQYTA